MSKFVNIIQSVAAFPIGRILLFGLFIIVFSTPFIYLLPIEIFYYVQYFPALVATSALVEIVRAKSKWHLFGFTLSKEEIGNVSIGTALPLIFFGVLALLAVLSGGEVIMSKRFSINILLFSLLNIAVFAISEELIFRGVLLQNLSKILGRATAAIILSLIFSLVHLSSAEYALMTQFNIFLAGLLMSIMYFKTKSLWLPITFHISWNFVQCCIFGQNVSGISMGVSVFGMIPNESLSYLFGTSAYGAESGFLTTIGLLLMFPIVLICAKENSIAAKMQKQREYYEYLLKNPVRF